jgi:hypothetical protein
MGEPMAEAQPQARAAGEKEPAVAHDLGLQLDDADLLAIEDPFV